MATHSTDDQALAAALAAARSEPEKQDTGRSPSSSRRSSSASTRSPPPTARPSPTTSRPRPERLGRRAAAFHEAWLGDDNASLARVLLRVLAVQPGADWAFMSSPRSTRCASAGRICSPSTTRPWSHRSARPAACTCSRRPRTSPATSPARPTAPSVTCSSCSRCARATSASRPASSACSSARTRWGDLIALWKRRIELQGREATAGLQARIAEASARQAARPALALEEVRTLLGDSPGDREGSALLERLILVLSAAPGSGPARSICCAPATRTARRPEEVIRVLGVALPLADAASAIALHREIGERLVAIDRAASAMEHYVALLALAPDAIDDQRRLRHLAETTGEYILYVMRPARRGRGATDGERRVALLAEAGDVQHDTLHDVAAAIELYTRVLAERSVPRRTPRCASPGSSTACSKRQVAAPSASSCSSASAPSRTARPAPRPSATPPAWPSRLGEPERALASWRARLGHDGDDSEALAHAIRLLEQLGPLGRAGRRPASARRRPGRAAPAPRRPASASPSSRPSSSTTPPPRSPPGARSSASSARTSETVEALAELLVPRDPLEGARRAARPRRRSRDRRRRRPLDPPRRRLPRPARPDQPRRRLLRRRAVGRPGARRRARGPARGARRRVARPAAVELLGKLYRKREEWPDLAGIVEARLAGHRRPAQAGRDPARDRDPAGAARQDPGAALGAAAPRLRPHPPRPRARARPRPPRRSDRRLAHRGRRISRRRRLARRRAAPLRRAAPVRGPHPRAQAQRARARAVAYTAVLAIEPGDPDAVRGAVRTAARVGRWDASPPRWSVRSPPTARSTPRCSPSSSRTPPSSPAGRALTLAVEAATPAPACRAAAAAFLTARVAVWHRDHRGDAAAARRPAALAGASPACSSASSCSPSCSAATPTRP
jgi:hypothetical protein